MVGGGRGVNEIEKRKEGEFEYDVVQLLRRRCRGNQGDKLSLQFFPLDRVGGVKNSWKGARGEEREQELLTDNEPSHQGNVLVGAFI